MSAFTALNGASPKQQEAANPHFEESRSATDEQSAPTRSALPDSQIRPSQHQQQSPPQSHSKVQSQSESRRDAWDAPADRPYHPTSTYPDIIDGSHKRKRSNSPQPRRELPPPQHSQQQSAPPPQQQQQQQQQQQSAQTLPSPESNSQSLPPLSRDVYATSQREYSGDWYHRQARDGPQQQQQQQPHAPAPSQPSPGEDVDALRRATAQADHSDFAQNSPDGDERSGYSFAPDQQRRDANAPGDQKKRKRNFSNRTKTGCLTCRKRKKKCDEQKPECSNCIKGGFLCAGYQPQRGPVWSKNENKAPPVLEPKDLTFIPTSVTATPTYNVPATYPNPIMGPKRDQLHHYRGQQLRIDPPQGRPILTDDDRPTASTLASASVASPDNKLSAISAYPGNVFPTPVSANPGPTPGGFGDRLGKDHYNRAPPLHELSRGTQEPSQNDMSHSNGGSLPQIQILNPTRSNSPVVSAQASQLAQMALSHNQYPTVTRPRIEKEEMLNGRTYYSMDVELVEDRKRCSTACWRYNTLTQPHNGLSEQERSRLLRDIVQPGINGLGPSRVGEAAIVETPFTCDYGYNLTIGHNVMINRDCSIQDAAEVKIGDNCHIGPNVKIYTGTVSTDPKRRLNGEQIAKPIVIEADCFIGGGAILLPGVTIGRGSTVGAGSVVTKNVPPMTVAVGNPARVARGAST
ncbi:hypothetical protein TD95_004204 [Thielaviopsis punctulata]|uniref:Zn(2)-C6 fungal-type domain-containing protein n=1 Tax=Thielaviopsis punctulata TaxID=72032 RepID=A0A0F4ZJ55_9PEZI|nr:hypothetical protein TD95_004204 [Thielaviopsis punctulata]